MLTYYGSDKGDQLVEAIFAPIAKTAYRESSELAPEEHADTQCMIQKWVESSISKTVNAPKSYTIHQVENLYHRLYEGGAKGGTGLCGWQS